MFEIIEKEVEEGQVIVCERCGQEVLPGVKFFSVIHFEEEVFVCSKRCGEKVSKYLEREDEKEEQENEKEENLKRLSIEFDATFRNLLHQIATDVSVEQIPTLMEVIAGLGDEIDDTELLGAMIEQADDHNIVLGARVMNLLEKLDGIVIAREDIALQSEG